MTVLGNSSVLPSVDNKVPPPDGYGAVMVTSFIRFVIIGQHDRVRRRMMAGKRRATTTPVVVVTKVQSNGASSCCLVSVQRNAVVVVAVVLECHLSQRMRWRTEEAAPAVVEV